MFRSLIVLCCMWLSFSVHADTYRWVDKQGNIHYSDQQPPSDAKESRAMKQKPKSMSAPTATAAKDSAPPKQKTYAEMDADFKKRQVEKAEAEVKNKKEMDEAAERIKQCERARNHLKNLENGGRFTRPGSDGETVVMDDHEVESAKVESKKRVAEWCKS